MGFRKNKYMTAMSSRKNAMKSLSVAVLAGCALFGAPAIADDTTTLPQGTYGTGDSAKYYKWETDATTGNTTLIETTEQEAQITANYDSSNPQTRLENMTDISSTPLVGNFINQSITITDYSVAGGGAIYNEERYANVPNIIGNITGDFIGNYVQSTYATSNAQGGAIYNDWGVIGNITGDFIGNYASSTATGDFSYASGGAICNIGGTIGNITGDFIGNYASSKDNGASGGAILGIGTTGDITGNFIGNYALSIGSYAQGGALNLGDSIGNIAGDFIGNYVLSTAIDGGYDVNGGAIHVNGTSGDITGDFIGNYVYSTASNPQGGAIHIIYSSIGSKDADDNLIGGIINSSFINNYTKSETGTAQGGAIYAEGSYLNIIAKDGYTSVFSGNYTESAGVKDDNAIALENANLNLQMLNGGKFLMQDNITVINKSVEDFYIDFGVSSLDEFAQQEGYQNIDELLADWGYSSVEEMLADGGYGPSTVNIQGDDINNTTFYLLNDIRKANVNIGNTTINTVNNLAHTYNFNSLTLTADTNMVVDVDLANQTMDRFSAKSYGEHQGNLNVTGMNLLSDATEDTTKILFAENGLKDNVTTTVTEVAYTPIYKYNVSYDKSGEDGYFVFTRPTSSGSGGTGSAGSFNPAVLGSSSSATVGALGTMNQTMNNVFQHSDNYMHIPYLERVSMRDRNKYALSLTGDSTGMGRYSPLYQRAEETTSVWVKPYATFETVGLKNGPKVHNNAYGTLIGFDTGLQPIKRGWDRVFTGYIGYNGASQRYSGIDSTQNGGLIGGTVTMYKGNFFNATTVSVGANVAQNQTMYGNEDFAMLLSGIGNKTGYNFEFKEGKLILQPSMLMSYTFVNTFDYTNAAGVRIDNKPLHALQLAPGVKVIGNLKGGWQPYASVQMVWNLMGESNATANGVKLPEMSIKPYVQYGVGVQKRIKDHFMAYGQAMIQNGGRNGVSLTAGFRWALGHDNCKYEKTQRHPEVKTERSLTSKEILRSAQNDRGKYIDNKTSSLDVGGVMPRAAEHKKILKQMTPQQRMAHGGKYYNTSRTAKSGSLRQY